jgi:hypothetical protein
LASRLFKPSSSNNRSAISDFVSALMLPPAKLSSQAQPAATLATYLFWAIKKLLA